MSLIRHDSDETVISSLSLGLVMTAGYTVEIHQDASFDLGVELDALPSLNLVAIASFDLTVDLDATPRLNNEPTVFGSAAFDLGVDLDAATAILHRGSARIGLGVAMVASPFILKAETSGLRLSILIVPAAAAAASQQATCRLLADGTEIPITAATEDNPASGIGRRVDLTLARVSDRAAVLAAASLSFDIGITISGSTTWFPRITGGSLESMQHSEAFQGGAPADQLSIGVFAPLSDRLNKSPDTDLIIYDPARAKVDPQLPSDVLKDTNGRTYPDELMEIDDLGLYDLFEEIFVNRCGFDGYESNLPDYKIRLASAQMAGGFFDAVKPHIGQFNPLTFERDGTIWIIDASMVLPAGFPDPDPLPMARAPRISLGQKMDQLDGYELQYSESGAGDYYTIREETDTEEIGDEGDPGHMLTVITTTFHDWRNLSAPGVIVRSELFKEVKETYNDESLVSPIATETLTKTYDGYNREIGSETVMEQKVPSLDGGDGSVSNREVRREKFAVEYKQHPFKRRKQIMAKTTRITTGMVATDTANPYLDEPFKQDFLEAHKAGNLKTEMTTDTETIKSEIETFTPLPNGQTIVVKRSIDVLRKIVTVGKSEVKTGDIELPGETSREARVIVLATDLSERTGKPIRPLNVGELPPIYGVPLARRQLVRVMETPGEISAEVFGYDPSIERGVTKTLPYRGGSFGSMMIEGYRIQFSRLGRPDQSVSTSVQGVVIG